MRRLWGTLLLLLGCWQTGKSLYRTKREELQRVDRLLYYLQEMEGEVMRLETPLPVLLERMEKEEKLTAPDYVPLPSEDFSERWTHFAASLPVGTEVCKLIEALGLSLCRDQEPEKVFSLVHLKLEQCREELEKICGERRRLAPALGACGGVLLALMLW